MRKIEAYRQGDILLVPVVDDGNELVDRFNVARQRREGIIVAEGEATGHHHRIRTRGAKMYTLGRRTTRSAMFVHVPKTGATLTHEEHSPLQIPPGTYRVVHQREYVERAPAASVYD